MSRVYFDRLSGIGIDPHAIFVTAGKRNEMDAGLVDHGNLQVTPDGDAYDVVPLHVERFMTAPCWLLDLNQPKR